LFSTGKSSAYYNSAIWSVVCLFLVGPDLLGFSSSLAWANCTAHHTVNPFTIKVLTIFVKALVFVELLLADHVLGFSDGFFISKSECGSNEKKDHNYESANLEWNSEAASLELSCKASANSGKDAQNTTSK